MAGDRRGKRLVSLLPSGREADHRHLEEGGSDRAIGRLLLIHGSRGESAADRGLLMSSSLAIVVLSLRRWVSRAPGAREGSQGGVDEGGRGGSGSIGHGGPASDGSLVPGTLGW